jgi:hypothetical protein
MFAGAIALSSPARMANGGPMRRPELLAFVEAPPPLPTAEPILGEVSKP